MSQKKCRKCGVLIPLHREYCSRRCLTADGWRRTTAADKARVIEGGGLGRIQAELAEERVEVAKHKARVDSLSLENAALRERVGALEGQVFEHDVMIRDLIRQIRALAADKGGAWDLNIPEEFR